MIQIRNVPDDLHRKLKRRAAETGKSLSEFLLTEVRALAERPGREQLRSRLASRLPVDPRPGPAAAVRAARDRR